MLSYRTIEPHTLELLKYLMAEPYLKDCRLVGGTALALQYGHRSSVDLDVFGVIPDNDAWFIWQIFCSSNSEFRKNQPSKSTDDTKNPISMFITHVDSSLIMLI